MKSVSDFSVVRNKAKQGPGPVAMARVILMGMAGVMMAGAPARAAQIEETEIDLVVDPNAESMTAQVHLHVMDNTGDQQLVCTFLKPTRMDYLREAASGRNVPYKFEQLGPLQYGVYQCTMSLSRFGRECVLELGYTYSGKDFYGYAMNPTTLDNLVLGQITQQSAYSSHLFYYPYTDGQTGKARITITVPQGWTGVSSGILQKWESVGDQSRFVYDIPYASGILPYPIAAFPYVVQETVYQDRVLVGIYSSAADAGHAQEKLQFLTTKVLPFLENLMGDYPLANLRIVEVFPREGNTGLATRGLVMLSEKMWFSAAIGESYDSLQAIVLVDECAHQWNIYHVQLPNYLGEGVSEYTDDLFIERFVDSNRMATNMAFYRQAYTAMVDQLNQLKPLKDAGMSIEQAARKLGQPIEAITPYWPYAAWGELPISDPRIFPTLYFLKGALAIHALRTQMGDELFFLGFKKLFSVSTNQPVTLDYYRQCFESVYGRSLEDFFHRWYYESGLPAN
jgi:aminopeptidase N